MKIQAFLLSIILLLVSTQANTEGCTFKNRCFNDGENITFYVFYTVAGVWVHAGDVSFAVKQEVLNSKPVYHVIGNGSTLPSYDWIYRVRDRYETYMDTGTLRPYKFVRNVDEGGHKIHQTVTFNQTANTAVSNEGVFKVPPCVQDVLSEVYMARNMDFNNYKVGDQIPFDMFLDNEVSHMYIRYLGKETVKTRYGKFRCIKFKPLLLKGSLFEGGEKMVVWVTDDANRLPVRIESPIVVGSVKADMMMYRNLRYPLTSLISTR